MYSVKRKKIQLIDVDKRIVESMVNSYKVPGPVILSSGRRSDYYYDIKSLLLDNLSWNQIKNILIKDLKHKFPEMTHVAGYSIGGISLAMRIASCPDFNIGPILVRDSMKEYGLPRQVEGERPKGGSRVVVVDDVVTTGKSFRKTTKILSENGIRSLGNYSLLKRKESHFKCESLIIV